MTAKVLLFRASHTQYRRIATGLYHSFICACVRLAVVGANSTQHKTQRTTSKRTVMRCVKTHTTTSQRSSNLQASHVGDEGSTVAVAATFCKRPSDIIAFHTTVLVQWHVATSDAAINRIILHNNKHRIEGFVVIRRRTAKRHD